jgi:hypothetical protein
MPIILPSATPTDKFSGARGDGGRVSSKAGGALANSVDLEDNSGL